MNLTPALAPPSSPPSAATPEQVRDEPRTSAASNRATVVVLAVGTLLIGLTHGWGRWLQARGHRMAVNAPPLTGNVDPLVSWWSVPAITVAAGAVGGADRLGHALSWRRLLWASFVAALTWSVALALWDGTGGLTRSPAAAVDYLAALPMIDGVGAFLRALIADTQTFPVHVQAHPPGMVMILLGLERAGVATPAWVAAMEHLAAASSVPAMLMVLRDVGTERVARAASPFLAFSTIAIAWSSGDAVILGISAWAVTMLVLATSHTGSRSHILAAAGGLLAAAALSSSYGVVLLAIVPAAVAWHRRRPGPLAIAAIPIAVALAVAAAAGFWWFDGLTATRAAYAESLARVRPYSYFLVANIAALAIAIGPAVWVGLLRMRDRRLWVLAAGALAAIVIADLSGLSKAEVERIWLPFMPWIVAVAGTSFADGTSEMRRGWLGLQVCWTLLVQSLVRAPW
jgi:hypothetical protein